MPLGNFLVDSHMPLAVGVTDVRTEKIAHRVTISRGELVQQSLEPHVSTPLHEVEGFGFLFRSPKSWPEYRKKKEESQTKKPSIFLKKGLQKYSQSSPNQNYSREYLTGQTRMSHPLRDWLD